MKIMELMTKKSNDLFGQKNPTIVFLGDSVTQGCFELYVEADNNMETYFDKKSAYHAYLNDALTQLYPNVPVNIINAGISGDSAPNAFNRLERDVLCHNPDLTVVCFGLNDCLQGADGIEKYSAALDSIFAKLIESGSEVIFMTPNMMNTKISCHILNTVFEDTAKYTMELQNTGIFDKYLEAAKDVANNHDIKICDVYSKWKTMAENGVDTTELLANRINHPNRSMNYLFASSLLEVMFS